MNKECIFNRILYGKKKTGHLQDERQETKESNSEVLVPGNKENPLPVPFGVLLASRTRPAKVQRGSHEQVALPPWARVLVWRTHFVSVSFATLQTATSQKQQYFRSFQSYFLPQYERKGQKRTSQPAKGIVCRRDVLLLQYLTITGTKALVFGSGALRFCGFFFFFYPYLCDNRGEAKGCLAFAHRKQTPAVCASQFQCKHCQVKALGHELPSQSSPTL